MTPRYHTTARDRLAQPHQGGGRTAQGYGHTGLIAGELTPRQERALAVWASILGTVFVVGGVLVVWL